MYPTIPAVPVSTVPATEPITVVADAARCQAIPAVLRRALRHVPSNVQPIAPLLVLRRAATAAPAITMLAVQLPSRVAMAAVSQAAAAATEAIAPAVASAAVVAHALQVAAEAVAEEEEGKR